MPAARKLLILLGLVVLISTAVLFAGDKKSKSHHPDASASAVVSPMEDDKRIIHALNRFTFGARPADVEKVRAEGRTKRKKKSLQRRKRKRIKQEKDTRN